MPAQSPTSWDDDPADAAAAVEPARLADLGAPFTGNDPLPDEGIRVVQSAFPAHKADCSDRGVMFNLRARAAVVVSALRTGTEFDGQGPVTVYTCDGPYDEKMGQTSGVWEPLTDPVPLPVLQERRLEFRTPLRLGAGKTRGFLIHGASDGAVGYRLEARAFADDFVLVFPGDYISRGDPVVREDSVRHNITFCGAVEYSLCGCAVDGCLAMPGPGGWMQFCARHAGIPVGAIAGAVGIVGTLPWKWCSALQRAREAVARIAPPPEALELQGAFADDDTPRSLAEQCPSVCGRQAAALGSAPLTRLSSRQLIMRIGIGPVHTDGLEVSQWLARLYDDWCAEFPSTGEQIEPFDVACAVAQPPPCPDLSRVDAPPNVVWNNILPEAFVDLRPVSDGALQYKVDGADPRPPTRLLEWLPPRILRFADIRRHAKLPPLEAPRLLAQLRGVAALVGCKHNITDGAIRHAHALARVHAAAQHTSRVAGDAHRCCMQSAVVLSMQRIQLALQSRGETDTWAQRLLRMRPETVADGIAAVCIYCYEALESDTGEPKPVQLSQATCRAMMVLAALPPGRPVPLRIADRVEWAESVLKVTGILLRHLDHFVQATRDPFINLMIRGGPGAHSAHYEPGFNFIMPYICCGSLIPDAAVEMARRATHGTLFVIQTDASAPMHRINGDEASRELLLPATHRMRVQGKLPRRLVMLLGTHSNVVSLQSCITDQPLTSEDRVELALAAVRHSRFVYDQFLRRFVEPRVDPEESGSPRQGAEPMLGARYDKFMKSEFERVLVVTGSTFVGRASLTLSLCARLLDMERPEVPIFVPVHSAGRALLDPRLEGQISAEEREEGLLCMAIARSLHLRPEDLPALKQRPLCIFLDGLDEAHVGAGDEAPGKILAQCTLLPRGGIRINDWPRTQFVVTAQEEWMKGHKILVSHIFPPSRVKFIRLVTLRVDNPKFSQGLVQVGCLQVYDHRPDLTSGLGDKSFDAEEYAEWSGEHVALPVISASCSDWCPRGEQPINAAKVDQKRWRAMLCPLVMELQNFTRIKGYRLQTANEPSERDPVSWRLEGADNPDGPWHLLDERGDARHPSDVYPGSDERWAFTKVLPCRGSRFYAGYTHVTGLTDWGREEYVRRLVTAEMEQLGERLRDGVPAETALRDLRAARPTSDLFQYMASAQDEEERADALRRCTAVSVSKTQDLIRAVAERAGTALVSGAFVLSMIVHAAEDFDARWTKHKHLLDAPRWEIFQVWLQRYLRERLRVCEGVQSVIQEPRRQLAMTSEALMRVAVRSFTSPGSQASVGECIEWLHEGDDLDLCDESELATDDVFNRGLLSCLPLFCEDLFDDGQLVIFRHASLRDMQIAAALGSVETPCDIWHEALCRRDLSTAPGIVTFWLERVSTAAGEPLESNPAEGAAEGTQEPLSTAVKDLLTPFASEAPEPGKERSLRSRNAELLLTRLAEAEKLAKEKRDKPQTTLRDKIERREERRRATMKIIADKEERFRARKGEVASPQSGPRSPAVTPAP
eukprot:TRINITY_DN3767_c2_g1_i2.p1 TRINITY_DN3767_c2_g1~~TRINITY_DN3767_c2_g1_i2.p1  ORF type:complete len:1520 (+),score=460.36 TRINITY_DN3767_c2_g1_i2:93-4652(+)